MDPILQHRLALTRRHFFGRAGVGIGTAALASLLDRDRAVRADVPVAHPTPTKAESGHGEFPNFEPRARRVIYLFQSGAPSQMDLFDFKPQLNERRATELPDSIRMGQRLTGMT